MGKSERDKKGERPNISQQIRERQKNKRIAATIFGDYIDLSDPEREDEKSPVILEIGEFRGLPEIPGCNPMKEGGGPLGNYYTEYERDKIKETIEIITKDLTGLDKQLRQWEELKRATETRQWSTGHRRYAGVKGSKSILKELRQHLEPDIDAQKKRDKKIPEIQERNISLICGGSTAALNFLSRKFGVLAYGYPGYVYDIHADFNSRVIPFEAWSLEELADGIMAYISQRKETDPNIEAAIINVPHNPLCYDLTEDSAKMLLELSKDVKLIFDSVYAQYNKEAMKLLSKIKNKIILRSFSKEFGMPGLRFCYAIFDNPKEKKEMEIFSSSVYSSIPNPVLLLAEWALQFNRHYGLSQHIVKQMNKRQNEFEKGIEGITKFGITPGDLGSMYRVLYLDNGLVSEYPERYNSRTFVRKCKDYGVIVKPLEVFAPPGKKLDKTGIRIAVSGSPRAYEGGRRVLEAAEHMFIGKTGESWSQLISQNKP